MTRFNTSSPGRTSFNSGFKNSRLSYKGIPREYPSGDKIPRAVRLRIAKEVQHMKDAARHDVYTQDNKYVATFNSEQEAAQFIIDEGKQGQYYSVKRPEDEHIQEENNKFNVEEERKRQDAERQMQDEEQGREALNQSLML
jgi:hypothetical protein